MTVAREALLQFYRREQLPTHGNQTVWVDWVTVFGVQLPLLNIFGRARVLPYHDLHHLVTGYRTDEAGECELGAWTLACGSGPLLGKVYDTMTATLGLIRFRERTVAAWRRGKRCQTLYAYPIDTLLEMEMDALRSLTGMDERTAG